MRFIKVYISMTKSVIFFSSCDFISPTESHRRTRFPRISCVLLLGLY